MKIRHIYTTPKKIAGFFVIFLFFTGINSLAVTHFKAVSIIGKDTVNKGLKAKSTLIPEYKTGVVQEIPQKPRPKPQSVPQVSHYTQAFRLESGGLTAYCLPDLIQGTDFSTPSESIPFIKGNKKQSENGNIVHVLTVLPNPASDLITINCKEGSLVYIFNYKGKQVLFAQTEQNGDLDVSGLACGIYTLKVEENGIFRQVQLIIQR